MAEYSQATLTIDDGVFELEGDLAVTEGIRTGFLVSGRGSSVWSHFASLLGADESRRKGVYLETGGGVHTIEIEFTAWRGSTGRWGDGGDTTQVTKTDAEGEKAVDQIQVLMHYIQKTKIDSTEPATLSFGQYSSSGVYDPLDVVLEGPNMRKQAEDGEWATGTMTCIDAADLTEAADSVVRNAW